MLLVLLFVAIANLMIPVLFFERKSNIDGFHLTFCQFILFIEPFVFLKEPATDARNSYIFLAYPYISGSCGKTVPLYFGYFST